jgi:hypothetical protein
MPKVSDEVKQQIRQSLLGRYQRQFGVNYMRSLHKNLIPSPIEEIAQTYNVSKSCVAKIRSDLLLIGLVVRGVEDPATLANRLLAEAP